MKHGDCISRQEAIDATWEAPSYTDPLNVLSEVRDRIEALPSAQPTHTDEEIQKMQDLEQAQIEKAYQLGYGEGKKDAQLEIIRCKDCKYQEKYFHKDRRRKDGGYCVYGCELAEGYSHVCLDDDFCSRAERRTDGEAVSE